MNYKKGVAKFFSGMLAFRAVIHACDCRPRQRHGLVARSLHRY